MTALGKKLQLKADDQLLLLKTPDGIAQMLANEGYTLIRANEIPQGSYKAALVFVESIAEMEQVVLPVFSSLESQAILWMAYPKKTSGVKTDLTRDDGWHLMASNKYDAVRQVAVNEVWSALRFRKQSERRKASAFGQDMPGIDRKAKTVIVPEDLEKALQEAGLLTAFESLAFTHRKEHVVAVLQAMKPETRARRVAKVVRSVAKLATKKVV